MNVPIATGASPTGYLGALAVEALASELALDPKPGLVTPTRRGSHADMDHTTFTASIAALAPYFADCAALGSADADFDALRRRALRAESAMLVATGGINTHKGAIFTLGLLTAAAGWRDAHAPHTPADDLGGIVGARWGVALVAHRGETPRRGMPTHGQLARLLHAVPGAREHAAAGFPTLFGVTLPAMRLARRRATPDLARLHALLTTMAVLPDTNLVHRGGPDGLAWAQRASEQFIADGSVFSSGWEGRLRALAAEFEARWLSPGGSADLLAAACFVLDLETRPAAVQAGVAACCA